ncbi:hypothetical protein Dimus_017378 [Dionaea muscipula]
MNPEDDLVREGKLSARPRQRWPTAQVARVNFDLIFESITPTLCNALRGHELLRNQFNGTSADIDRVIAECTDALMNQAMNELWNRLRKISETYSPATRTGVFTRKAPALRGFELPRFIASLLSGIGPLHIDDGPFDTYVIYAPCENTRDHFGRGAATLINPLQVLRLIEALKAANIPLGTIQQSGSVGAYFTTCSTRVERDTYEICGAFSCHHYTRNDVIMAMFFSSWDDARYPFEDLSCTIDFVDNEEIVNRIEGLSVEAGGDQDADITRLVHATYEIDYHGLGVAPASNVTARDRGRGIYILGRGFKRHYHCSLARGLTNYDMYGCLRHRILSENEAAARV